MRWRTRATNDRILYGRLCSGRYSHPASAAAGGLARGWERTVRNKPHAERGTERAKRTTAMKRAISLDSTVIAAKDQASCELSGESVILNLKNGVYYGLDRVGTRIWNLIQAPTMVASIRDSLLAEYEVDSGRCEADLLRLLQKLADQELVHVVDEKVA